MEIRLTVLENERLLAAAALALFHLIHLPTKLPDRFMVIQFLLPPNNHMAIRNEPGVVSGGFWQVNGSTANCRETPISPALESFHMSFAGKVLIQRDCPKSNATNSTHPVGGSARKMAFCYMPARRFAISQYGTATITDELPADLPHEGTDKRGVIMPDDGLQHST